jgi:Ring finger domain
VQHQLRRFKIRLKSDLARVCYFFLITMHRWTLICGIILIKKGVCPGQLNAAIPEERPAPAVQAYNGVPLAVRKLYQTYHTPQEASLDDSNNQICGMNKLSPETVAPAAEPASYDIEAAQQAVAAAADIDGVDCVICFEQFTAAQLLMKLPCPHGHVYHAACVSAWLDNHKTCPICNHTLSVTDVG